MFEAEITTHDNVTVARLSGSLDETVDFARLIGAPPPALHVYAGQVDRISSQGVIRWIAYFKGFKAKVSKLEFHEVSPALVASFNEFYGFGCGGRVISVRIPYFCDACHTTATRLVACDSLRGSTQEYLTARCPNCGEIAGLDDDPASFFKFLKAST